MKITNEIISCFLYCPYKIYLKLADVEGVPSAFQKLEGESKVFLLSELFPDQTLRFNLSDINYLIALSENETILFQEIVTDHFHVSFDAIEILKGPSEFQIIPIEVFSKIKPNKSDMLYMAIKCLILERFLKKGITYIKIYNSLLQSSKINITTYKRTATKLLYEIEHIYSQRNEVPFFRIKECAICEYQERCLKILKERDDLSLLGGINKGNIAKYHNKGIFTVNQLSYNFRPRKYKNKTSKKHFPELTALAIRESKIYIWDNPSIQNAPSEFYVDIEILPDQDFIYLIGVLHKQGTQINYKYFWMDTNTETEQTLSEFTRYLLVDDYIIYHYGSIERQFFSQLNKKGYNINLDRTVDVLSIIANNIYFPTYSNSLKEICNYLGFRWDTVIKSGLDSIVKRKTWEKQRKSETKNELIFYNKADCEALIFLVDTIKYIHQNDIVKFAGAIKQTGSYKWRDPDDYFEDDYKFINKLSYFNYNQEKIYFRTNSKSKVARNTKIKAKKVIDYSPNEIIEIFPRYCPRCKTTSKKNLTNRLKLINRKVIDLKFMKNGIKRWIIQHNSGLIQCRKCSHVFGNKNFLKLKMFGDNLKKWCANQHISYHMSFNSIAASLKGFNININKIRAFEFKRDIAQKYNSIYNILTSELINGSLINVDETEVKIKGINKGYVWVFASMDTVVYLYRQSREAGFLKGFLKDFSGVLVSDFYSGYDSLPCKQQKCLVHLIRDLNSDFYKNQLDIELKLIVTTFGSLLRDIVETIDKYGLKRRNLNKHLKKVEMFYKSVISKEFKSELAFKYQNRFIKYKSKLFAFLENDNIPWHNNNAEYAIKSFAKHREKGNRIFTEASIKDYMILLSIEQTCHYRGLRFMDFLMKPELLK